jgi:hypothetical protein
MAKQGTPTMGGLAIIAAAFVGWMVAHVRDGLVFSTQAMIMWCGILIMSVMGFLDDYIKITKAHNRGIFWKRKSWITFGLAIGVAAWLSAGTGISETFSTTRATYPGWTLNTVVWIVWAGIIIWSTTNAVNVTDGLDGLAGGSAMMTFVAFAIPWNRAMESSGVAQMNTLLPVGGDAIRPMTNAAGQRKAPALDPNQKANQANPNAANPPNANPNANPNQANPNANPNQANPNQVPNNQNRKQP